MRSGGKDFDEKKREIACRRRRLIFNNDGGDAKKPPEVEFETPRDFLDIRTSPLRGSHVDTVSYCTSRGFGVFTHRTAAGRQDVSSPVVSGLGEEGTDPLKVMVEYCHAGGMEVFWSMRMNDTHDGSRPEMFRANRFKAETPDVLLGGPDDPPLYGQWSAVDYARAPVREMARRFVEEVCRGYDVDGIELDFFRHPVFFRGTSRGEPVEDRESGMMTSLISDIAATALEEGRRRGRPFLIAARVPDDTDYCSTIGLEIERWMRDKLIDIYIPGGYFRLNSWEYSVKLGHRFGVKVYPGLSESRVGGGHHADFTRASDECYRARAMNAWNSGADGVYVFNLFDPLRKIWREMGEPGELAGKDKAYFASNRGTGRVAGGAYPHAHFMNIPRLNPGAPVTVRPGERKTVKLEIGEIIPGCRQVQPQIRLDVRVAPGMGRAEDVTVSFNGRRLKGKEGSLQFPLEPGFVRRGYNTVEIIHGGQGADMLLSDVMARVDYSGSFMGDDSYIRRTRERM